MKILVRFVACLLYCLGSIAPLHAIEATHSPNIKHNDAIHTFDALIQMIKTPTNVTELLHNIKFAVDHELPMSRDFYQEAILKRFSGGEVIKISSFGDRDISFNALKPADVFEGKSNIGSFLTSGLSHFYDKPTKKYAYLNIYIPHGYKKKFTYDTLTAVFGTDAVFTDPPEESASNEWLPGSSLPAPEPGSVPMSWRFDRGEVTHPHGNKDFLISWRHNQLIMEVTGEIMGNGEVDRFKITQEEE